MGLAQGAFAGVGRVAEIPADGKAFRIRAIKKDARLRQRQAEIARKGGKARRPSMTAEEWKEFSARGRAARAPKVARQKQMTELGRMGEQKTQDVRRAQLEEQAANAVDN